MDSMVTKRLLYLPALVGILRTADSASIYNIPTYIPIINVPISYQCAIVSTV